MERQRGILVEWDDARGFGFIRPDDGSQRLFVHISTIRRIATRPRIGDRLTFATGIGRDGRPAAMRAEILDANPLDLAALRRGEPQARPALPVDIVPRLALAILIGVAVAVDTALPWGMGWLAPAYLGAGVVSIAAYWLDKSAAETGQRRIRENDLHLIDLCFGIAGGLVAQALLRHKVSKHGFAVVSFGTAFIHLAGLAAIAGGLVPG